MIKRLIFTAITLLVSLSSMAKSMVEIWSSLENESSCNGKKWAKLLQEIMVDKTERHFDIDLSKFKHVDDVEEEI